MQPLQYDLRDPAAKNNANTATARSNLDAVITTPERKKHDFKTLFKVFLGGKSLMPKWRKFTDKSLWQPSYSYSNTIYKVRLQKTIVLRL